MATKIEMFPSGNGEAFLFTHEVDKKFSALIDGGYASTYDNFIRPKLIQLSEDGWNLNLLVATHVDADHITGVLKLMEQNGLAHSPSIIPVELCWYNGLRSLALEQDGATEISEVDLEVLSEIHDKGIANPETAIDSEISARQGSSLSSLLSKNQYKWNEGKGKKPIQSPLRTEWNSEIEFTVLGPSTEQIQRLRDWWIDQIRQYGISKVLKCSELVEDVFEFLASRESHSESDFHEIASSDFGSRELSNVYKKDVSVTNASSISFTISTQKHCLLFCGDSWAEDIQSGLEESYGLEEIKIFDVIKVSHHGSLHNTSPALLEKIDSPKFLISTDGKRHGHPDIEVLKAIVDRPSDFERELFFTSSTPASRFLRTYHSKSGAGFRVIETPDEPTEIHLE